MPTFLKAQWRKLLMANYAVDAQLLQKYLPAKTEIDTWNGKTYVSLVAFMFLDTQVMGLRVPFHINFEEVNLRFYVRHKYQDEWRRGVVFIKEIVPKPAIAWVANILYGEHYQAVQMRHTWENTQNSLNVRYEWLQKPWNSISAECSNIAQKIVVGSEEEFITEHYWGYTKINDERTSEYGVEHPTWDVYACRKYTIDVDFAANYGEHFAYLNQEKPLSVFLAEGSEIMVNLMRKV